MPESIKLKKANSSQPLHNTPYTSTVQVPMLPDGTNYVKALGARSVLLWTGLQLLIGCPALYYSYYFVAWYELRGASPNRHQFTGVCLYTFLVPFAIMLITNAITRIATFTHASINLRVCILIFFSLISLWGGIFFLFPKFWDGIAYWKLENKDTKRYPIALISFEMSLLYIPISILLMAMAIRLILFQRKFETNNNFGILPNIPFSFNQYLDKSTQSIYIIVYTLRCVSFMCVGVDGRVA